MSGEAAIAKRALENALQETEGDRSKTTDAVLLAFLGEALTKLSASRSRADIESYISYQLDNVGEEDWVITRGC